MLLPYTDKILQSTRARLNGLIVCGALMKWLCWTGLSTGLIIVAAKIAGVGWADWRIWIGLCIAGGLAGWITGMTRRISLAEAARWLDAKLNTQEAFSAALVCTESAKPGPFSHEVLSRAEDWAGDSATIHWPWRSLFRWGAGALASIVVFSLLITARLPCLASRPTLTTAQGHLLERNHPLMAEAERTGLQSPKALAEKLFPQNPRLARKLEEALQRGDTVALENLLKDAEWDTDSMNDRETAPADPGRVEMERQRMERRILEMARGEGTEISGKTAGSRNGNGQTGREGGGKRHARRPAQSGQERRNIADGSPGQDEIPSERQGPQGQGRERRSSKSEQGDRGKGQQAGKGKGNVNKYWGDLTGSNSPTRAVITQRKDGPMLEYVLPGKKMRTPLKSAVSNARRSAESAMTKQEVPGEYEAFVRSYFLKLSEKSSGQSKKEGQP